VKDTFGPVPLPGFWDSRLAPFLDRYCFLLCLCLVGIACLRIVTTYNALSITVDEPTHFASGLEYVTSHTYRTNPEHPPLSRMMQALGPYFAGARPVVDRHDPGVRELVSTGNVDRAIFLMRLGNLPFYLLACLVVGGLSRHWFGRPVAVLALCLFTLLPNMLADAGLATTDMALGATVGATFFAMLLWAERPSSPRSVLLGFCTGSACLSKFTALGYIPVAACLALLFYLIPCWPGWVGLWRFVRQRLGAIVIAAITAALLIWAAYWFSFGIESFHGKSMRVPAPDFFDGIRAALLHNRVGHPAFLLGEFRWKGWWYYFPVALAVKTPIAFLILFALGAYVCLRERKHPTYLIPLALILGILLPAMSSQIDIGIRHIEPIYIGLSIVAALGLRQLIQWARTGAISVLSAGVLVSWLTISVAVHHPDYLAYFNEIAGKTPERILVDSNYDWGQELKLLGRRLHQLDVKEISLASMLGPGYSEPERTYLLETSYDLPTVKEANPCAPSPGWTALSTTIEKSLSWWPDSGYYRGSNMSQPWYEQTAPTDRVGGMLLYNLPPGIQVGRENCQ